MGSFLLDLWKAIQQDDPHYSFDISPAFQEGLAGFRDDLAGRVVSQKAAGQFCADCFCSGGVFCQNVKDLIYFRSPLRRYIEWSLPARFLLQGCEYPDRISNHLARNVL